MHLKAKLCAEDNTFLQERSFPYVFLALLFASIFDKLFSYVAGIFTEIQLRM